MRPDDSLLDSGRVIRKNVNHLGCEFVAVVVPGAVLQLEGELLDARAEQVLPSRRQRIVAGRLDDELDREVVRHSSVRLCIADPLEVLHLCTQ